MSCEQTTTFKTYGERVAGLSRLVCRIIRLTDDGVRRYESLVGASHSRTRDQLGTGDAEALTAYPQEWKAVAVLRNLRRHQCL